MTTERRGGLNHDEMERLKSLSANNARIQVRFFPRDFAPHKVYEK